LIPEIRLLRDAGSIPALVGDRDRGDDGVMRTLLVIAAIAGTAEADPVRELVEKTLPGGGDTAGLLAKNAVVVSVRGNVSGDLEDRFAGPFVSTLGDLNYKLGPLEVVHDKGFAWFYGTVDVTLAVPRSPAKHVMQRVSGIAIGGKLAAIMYASPLDDKELVTVAEQRKTTLATAAPSLAGDLALGRLAADWFTGGHLARDRSTNGKVWASGTAPKELGAGAAAAKLVAGWDALHLGATKIDARMFAGGDVGFVAATVRMPVGKVAAEMVLGAVVVKEAAGYRWVTLSFTPTADPSGFDPRAH
jgi:hypothetical protein